jgi:methylmalonyl-CoA carboxyltransferase large subunit
MSKVALDKLAGTVEELQRQVALLTERLAQFEQPPAEPAAAAPQTRTESPQAEAPAQEEISPEILLAISAAVAAYLGERAHVRAVRLISHTRWSQEGRVSIQASHHLNRG